MTDTLHVFAVSAAPDLRHTHLTRAEGLAPDLPPLTEWLGAEADTGEIELFPIRDLGDMQLSDYVTMAFAPEEIGPQAMARINGIKGHVLLVPDRALSEEPAPGKEAVLVASLPLAAADHRATLPKAMVGDPTGQGTEAGGPALRLGGLVWLVLVPILACAGLLVAWLS